ncbi:PCSK5-like protein, partial [Mya arenaria]
VKNIYTDTSMFPVAGEYAGNTTGDNDNYPDISESDFLKCPPFFDTAQQIDSTWIHGYTGRNVTIGVIDVGIDTDNPELEENIAGRIRKFHGERYPQMNASSFSAALGYKYQNIQIYSNSLTFVKPFARMEPFTARVVERSILQGRGGLFVFPAGLPGNGFANSIHTISVKCIGENGKVPPPVFANSATLLTVTHTARRFGDRKCDNKFGGSSAATAIISGIVALALQIK